MRVHSSDIAPYAVVLCATLAFGGCGDGRNHLTEVQRAKAGTVSVVVLSSRDAVRHGKDTFVLEFRSPEESLADVGDVRATATMPMTGMPMFGSIDVRRTNIPGRYSVESQLEMAGTWRMNLQWTGGGEPRTLSFSWPVQ